MSHSLIRSIEHFEKVKIDYSQPVFCDTETSEEEGRTDGGLYGRVRLVQIYQDQWKGHAAIIDCLFVPLETVLEKLKPAHLVLHNGAYDLHTINLHTPEFWYPEKVDDTLYLGRLIYSTMWKFTFYDCLGYARVSDDIIKNIDKKANQKADWGGPLSEDMLLYAEYDVTYLSKLYHDCKIAETADNYLLDIWNLEYAVEYSRRGVPFSIPRVKERLLEATEKLENVLHELPVNPNSPKQVVEWLGSRSSDKKTLVKLGLEGNEKATMVSDARKLSKEVMFLKKYSKGSMKGFFQPCASLSGRFSCTGGDSFDHGNLQQIPKRLLNLIEAPEGKSIVYMDYSGLELRMAVAYTGEPTMERLFRDGTDMHGYTGSQVSGQDIDSLDTVYRTCGKALNFNMIFGASDPTIQDTIMAWGNILFPLNEVSDMTKKWFETYDYFKQWHMNHKKDLKVYGYMDVRTALGRAVRCTALPDSLNIPIQGSSAEVQKTALKNLKTRYPNENLINTIHDSNALLVPDDEAEDWKEALNDCMVDAWYTIIEKMAIPDLPMPREAEISKTWSF